MKMKRNLNRGILATLGIVCLSACATDGTLNVSGTVDWFDATKWDDGQIASGGNATVKGGGTVNLTSPVTIGALGYHPDVDGETSLKLTGEKLLLSTSAAEGARLNLDGRLESSAPIEFGTNLTISGGAFYPRAQVSTTGDGTFHLSLAKTLVGLDFSVWSGGKMNMLPQVPLFVGGGGASTLRLGGGTDIKQIFTSYDINNDFVVGGMGTLVSPYIRGVAGQGNLQVGTYQNETITFDAADLSTRYSGHVTVKEQSRVVLHPLEEISSTLPVTAGCLFHVDASDAATLTTDVRGGRTVVTRWADASGGANAAVAPDGAQSAVLRPNELNGRPVVDFGAATGNGGMDWVNTLTGIQDVFMVVGSQDGGGTLLGTKQDEGAGYLFERGRNIHATKGSGTEANYSLPLTRDAVAFYRDDFGVYMHGESDATGVNAKITGLSGEYDLLEFRPGSAGTASAFARRAGLTVEKRAGREAGQRLAEVVIYDHTLPEEDRRRVAAYLLKKWFNKERAGFGAAKVEWIDLQPQSGFFNNGLLLNAVNGAPVRAKNLKIAADAETSTAPYYTVNANDNLIADRAQIGRKLRFAGGKVTLTARQTSTTLPVPAPAFHVDASTLDVADGAAVTRWNDASGGTVYAEAEGADPTLVADRLNGKPVVDFGANSSCRHFRWSSNIVVRTLFFVQRVTNNNVTFLGSSCPQMAKVDNFTRYQNTKDFIYNNGSHDPNVEGGLCWLDGIRILKPTDQAFNCNAMPSGFRILAHALEGGMMANAFGCGAYESGNHRAERTGGLQIAEAIIYDRKLTEDECLDVQAYLRWKWFGETLGGYVAPNEPYTLVAAGSANASSRLEIRGTAPVTVNELFGGNALILTAPETTVTIPAIQGSIVLSNACVASSAAVPSGKVTDLPGTTNTLAAGSGTFAAFNVTGAFAVKGPMAEVTALTFASGSELVLGTNVWERHSQTLGDGMTISSEVAADRTTGHLALCDVAVAGGGTVKLALDPALAVDPVGQYPVVTYGSLATEDIDNLRTWNVSVTPALPEKYHVSLAIVNNAVYVNIAPSGMIIIVR